MAPVERDLRLFEELERLLGPPVRPLVPAPVATMVDLSGPEVRTAAIETPVQL
ncbi:MAG: hypothetical protein RI544_07170, partial [Haloquadratum sp.]|nr:hypothetical protein [Haloquadratum sp.]